MDTTSSNSTEQIKQTISEALNESITVRKFTYVLKGKTCQKSKYVTNDSKDVKELAYNNKKWLKEALPSEKQDDPFDVRWVKKTVPANKLTAASFTDKDYEEESTNVKQEDYTHTGLIQYLAVAWANEKGIILRPDMFHHQIVCEIAKDVIENPEMYRSLYTKSSEKTNIEIITMGSDDEFISLLDEELEKSVPDKEFKKLFTDVKFKSQPETYEIVKRICFSHSATPFYNYMRTLCGYPSISIPDVLEDWINLYDFTVKIATIIKNKCNYVSKYSWETDKTSPIVKYLVKCASHIKEIIDLYFDNEKIKEKLNNIFYIEDEYRCGSGHDSPYNVYGWITDFYVEKHSTLNEYPARLPYLPYKFTGIGNYSIVTGLTSSKLTDDILEAEYGRIVIKIKNQKLFDIIKN